jgi:hypothetical protein
VTDGKGAPVTCSTTATIVDTTPPVIVSATASPTVIWPPNHKMVRVVVSVVATDICSTVSNRIKSVTSNEPIKGPGKNKNPDWTQTAPLTVMLRAERLGKGNGRTYTLTIESADTSGNTATKNVTVSVPHDQRANASSSGKSGNNGNGANNSNQGNQNNGSNSSNSNNSNGNSNSAKGNAKNKG